MKFEPGDYGIVKVIDGLHKGRIGYYDDDDIILPEDETFDDDESIYNESKNIERVAIVYFGTFLLAPGYYSIPYNEIEYASMNDLMTRKDELFNLCSPFVLKKKINHKELCSYFSELHLVETTLLEKIVEQRYVNKPTGFKIFISHSSKDKPFAKLLCMDLEANGYIPWLDEWNISVGESIPEKISSGLQEADFIIVILSEDSVSSKWVEREWQIKYWNEIEKGHINVLPILLKDCQIPELLRTKKYADFRTDFNRGLNDLLSALENLSRKL
ncbi:toll/interleukin-1 receptor domain-containing protein [Pectobacterium sp. CHL-2024]|uniref:toll/interleukin-1 receptor domain-containing protein n=1 Tax=Pectobacterium sp. CHL-2024 TaxID=3377079 RepID=UPI003829D22D